MSKIKDFLGQRSKVTLACIAGTLIFAAFVSFSIAYFSTQDPESVYDVVLFGDSIMAVGNVGENLQNALLDERVFDLSIGGSSVCLAPSARDDYTADLLSFSAMTNTINTGDYSLYKSLYIRIPANDYVNDLISEFDDIDFSATKVFVCLYGINDFHLGVDVEHFKEEYIDSVNRLKEINPDAVIILATPTYAWYIDEESKQITGSEDYYINERTPSDYVDAVFEVGRECDAPVIDLYHSLYGNGSMADMEKYTVDGMHPTSLGALKISNVIFKKIKEIY